MKFSEQVASHLWDKEFNKKVSHDIWPISWAEKILHRSVSEVYELLIEGIPYYFKSVSRWTYRDIIAFDHWKKKWIRVPNIKSSSDHNTEIPRYIMEKIEWQLTDFKPLKDSQKFHWTLWEILSKMHQEMYDGYHDIHQWINEVTWKEDSYPKMFEKKYPIKKMIETGNRIGISSEEIIEAKDLILRYSEWKKASLCHNDLYLHNIFCEDEPIIIDPNVDLDLWVMDLWRTIFYTIKRRYYKDVFETIKWYWWSIEKEIILAATLIRSLKVLRKESDKQKMEKFKKRYLWFQKEYRSN